MKTLGELPKYAQTLCEIETHQVILHYYAARGALLRLLHIHSGPPVWLHTANMTIPVPFLGVFVYASYKHCGMQCAMFFCSDRHHYEYLAPESLKLIWFD